MADKYRKIWNGGNRIWEHLLIAEKALGHPLPKGVEVHHVDENGLNNVHTNLVICQDRAYHGLLHQRTRAFRATGHADWRKCKFCKQWDSPEHLYVRRGTAYHRACCYEDQKRGGGHED